MKLSEIQVGHTYDHRMLGEVTIVGQHPFDGAAFISVHHDANQDEEVFTLCVPEDFMAHISSNPGFRTELTDAVINEITYDRLGKWPSFEAQSWACKVVHELTGGNCTIPTKMPVYSANTMGKLNDGQRLAGLIELCGHYQDGSSQIVKLFSRGGMDDSYQLQIEDFGTQKKRFVGLSFRNALDLAIAANPDALTQAMNCPAAKPDPDGLRFRVLMLLLSISDNDANELSPEEMEAIRRMDECDADTPEEFAALLDTIIADKLLDVQ